MFAEKGGHQEMDTSRKIQAGNEFLYTYSG